MKMLTKTKGNAVSYANGDYWTTVYKGEEYKHCHRSIDELAIKLSEFEDFMESEGFQDLKHLAFTIEEQKKINEAYEKENKTFKFMWQRLKEFIMDELNEDNHNYEMTGIRMYDHYSLADQTILDKMLNLEENNSICSMK